MRFQYSTEIKDNGMSEPVLFVPGEARFKVTKFLDTNKDGTPKTTSKGAPKITGVFTVIDSKGNKGTLFEDFSFETGWKMKAFLESINMGHLFDGDLDTDLVINCMGRCVLVNKEYKGELQTEIKYFSKPKTEQAAAPAPAPKPVTPPPGAPSKQELDQSWDDF